MEIVYQGMVIIIPTRNRADLASNAVRSALSQSGCGALNVMVSDNSTEPQETESLARFCQSAGDARLGYVRPPEPLPMSAHWDWAARQALERYDASHIAFLTDRMIFKPGALAQLSGIASQYPRKIISYMHDSVADDAQPVRLAQRSWTGALFKVEAARALQLSSRSTLHELLPRMLNCLVPRTVLCALRARFGQYFDSYAPDFNFCYRALALEDDIVFYDAALLIHYAFSRSNGASVSRGEMSKDRADYMAHINQARGYYATPIPRILSVHNAIAHEYCLVREETRSPQFPPLDKERYLRAIAGELYQMVNPQVRAETEALLAAHGLVTPELAARRTAQTPLWKKLLSPRRVAGKLAREAAALSAKLPGGGRARAGVADEEARAGGLLEFPTTEAALAHAIKFPLPQVESQPELEELFEFERLPARIPRPARVAPDSPAN